MNREEVDFVFNAPIGSQLRLDTRGYTVVGRFAETYHPKGTKPTTAHVLSLSGMEEIGAEHRDDDWYLWHSAFREAHPLDSAEARYWRNHIEEMEKGRIQRHKSEGTVGRSYPEYVFGRKNGSNIFMPYDDKKLEVWYTKEIKPEDVQLL